jgi:hypothetical protein
MKRKRGTDVLTWDCGAGNGSDFNLMDFSMDRIKSLATLLYTSDYTTLHLWQSHLLIWFV